MKKLFSYLFAASTACTFSFWKMEESGVLKQSDNSELAVTFVCDGDQTDEMFRSVYETLGSENPELYFAYLYDPISKCLFISPGTKWAHIFPSQDLKFEAVKHAFNLLLGNKYSNLQDAKNSLGVLINDQNLLQFMTNHPNAVNYPDLTQFVMTRFASTGFLINTNDSLESTKNIKQWVNKKSGEFFKILNKSGSNLAEKNINDLSWQKNFVSPSGINVSSTEEGLKLTKTLDGREKTIDFQNALSKYLEKQIYPFSDFSQSFIKLDSLVKAKKTPTSLYEKDITYKGTQREDSLVKEFLDKKERFCHLEKQRDLLNHSEILTIRYLIDKEDNSGKCTIIGTAINKHTLTTFHWITELREEELDELFED